MATIIAAGTFDREFGRNRRLLALLERAGHEVVLCQTDLFATVKYDIVQQRKLRMLVRGLTAYPRLAWRFMRLPRADAVLVMYPGWFDMIVVGMLARLRRLPVIFDIYISLYDTVVSDRHLASARSLLGRASKLVDWLSIRSARRLLADTPAHAEFYAQLVHMPRDRIGVVWVGAEDDVFRPQPDIAAEPRRVLFYGTFIKLHGLDVIVRAAKLLEPDGVEFRIIGSGQEQAHIEALIEELQPANVAMQARVPLAELPREIASAQLCCGIFGTSEKAGRVVPNKVFECIAVGRPVVTADTPGIRSAFADDEIALAPAGDAEALAQTIRKLLGDPAELERMAQAARRHYLDEYATDTITRLLDAEVRAALAMPPR